MAAMKPDKNNGFEIIREIIANDYETYQAAISELIMLDLLYYEKSGNTSELKMTSKAKRLYIKNNYDL